MESVLPSKLSFHPSGENGVTTSLPQPQQHLWIAVAYSMEMYKTPFSSVLGIDFTNLCCNIKIFINCNRRIKTNKVDIRNPGLRDLI